MVDDPNRMPALYDQVHADVINAPAGHGSVMALIHGIIGAIHKAVEREPTALLTPLMEFTRDLDRHADDVAHSTTIEGQSQTAPEAPAPERDAPEPPDADKSEADMIANDTVASDRPLNTDGTPLERRHAQRADGDVWPADDRPRRVAALDHDGA